MTDNKKRDEILNTSTKPAKKLTKEEEERLAKEKYRAQVREEALKFFGTNTPIDIEEYISKETNEKIEKLYGGTDEDEKKRVKEFSDKIDEIQRSQKKI